MIELFTSATPNGFRASIALEEAGLAYRVRVVDLAAGEHKSAAFLAVNATGRIPAIVDDDGGDGGSTVAVTETLAIALYAAEKSGKLMSTDRAERALAWQWGATVISGFGSATPGIFFARQLDAAAHTKIIAKFFQDIQVYLGAMEQQLAATPWLAGSTFSVADVLAIPTIVLSLPRFEVDLQPFPAIRRWRDACLARPGVQRGFDVPAQPPRA